MFQNKFFLKNIKKFYKNLNKKNYSFNKKLIKNLILKKNNILKKINKKTLLNSNKKSNKIKKHYKKNQTNIYKKYLTIINKNIKIFLLKISNLIHYTTSKKNIIIKEVKYNKKNICINKLNFNIKISNKSSGRGFYFINSPLSILYKNLENYMLKIHILEHNYKYIKVPNIMNFRSLINSGQIPKFLKKLFIIKNKKKIKYLIPTAEVSLINFMINKKFNSKYMPLKFLSLTECYRNENLSYGKDNKNLIRRKEFGKIELIQMVENKISYKFFKEMLKNIEKILKNLKISYRIVSLSNKETSFTSLKTYDFEIWLPSINNYCEVSSCSNSENYQSIRTNIKYIINNNNKKKEYTSIINGSGLAVDRVFLAILENYSLNNNIIKIPKVLKKEMRIKFLKI